MPFVPGTYILGPAHSLRIVPDANGLALGLPSPIILDGDRESFEADFADEVVTNDTIDNGGRVVPTRIPGGVKGSIEFDKSNQDFSQLMMTLDQAYYNGSPKVTFTMTETINLADGTQEQNQFQGVVLHGYKKGKFDRKNVVKPSVQFTAVAVVPV